MSEPSYFSNCSAWSIPGQWAEPEGFALRALHMKIQATAMDVKKPYEAYVREWAKQLEAIPTDETLRRLRGQR